MKSIVKSSTLAFALLLPTLVLAHEGHDDAPGQVRSQNGGVVKAGSQLNMEMVTEGSKVSFYPIAHGGDKVSIADVKVTATAQSPKRKPVPLKLEAREAAYVGTVDLGSATRSSVEVKTNYKGKPDTFKFQVEKQ